VREANTALPPNPRLQRTGAAVLAQPLYCEPRAFGGLRRPPLKRKALGNPIGTFARGRS